MNALFELRLSIPACALTLALSAVALPAGAQVHKCKNADGSTIYQQAPCDKTGTTGDKIDLQDPTKGGAAKSGGKVRSSDGTSQQSMSEAFQRRMDKKDYEGAMAFATTDRQKAQARQKLEDKNNKCSTLSIRKQKAQADFQAKGERYKSGATAAEAEYNLNCR